LPASRRLLRKKPFHHWLPVHVILAEPKPESFFVFSFSFFHFQPIPFASIDTQPLLQVIQSHIQGFDPLREVTN